MERAIEEGLRAQKRGGGVLPPKRGGPGVGKERWKGGGGVGVGKEEEEGKLLRCLLLRGLPPCYVLCEELSEPLLLLLQLLRHQKMLDDYLNSYPLILDLDLL